MALAIVKWPISPEGHGSRAGFRSPPQKKPGSAPPPRPRSEEKGGKTHFLAETGARGEEAAWAGGGCGGVGCREAPCSAA